MKQPRCVIIQLGADCNLNTRKAAFIPAEAVKLNTLRVHNVIRCPFIDAF
jgi:hypothetical protein